MRFAFEYETEQQTGTLKTLPIDVCLAEKATGQSVIDGLSFTMITHMVHSSLTRAAKRGDAKAVAPYPAWIETLLSVKEVTETAVDGEPIPPTEAASSNTPTPDESAALPTS